MGERKTSLTSQRRGTGKLFSHRGEPSRAPTFVHLTGQARAGGYKLQYYNPSL